MIGATEEEVKAIFCVLAAVYHLGVAGATKGMSLCHLGSLEVCLCVTWGH